MVTDEVALTTCVDGGDEHDGNNGTNKDEVVKEYDGGSDKFEGADDVCSSNWLVDDNDDDDDRDGIDDDKGENNEDKFDDFGREGFKTCAT